MDSSHSELRALLADKERLVADLKQWAIDHAALMRQRERKVEDLEADKKRLEEALRDMLEFYGPDSSSYAAVKIRRALAGDETTGGKK